jgi:hypothetical protein
MFLRNVDEVIRFFNLPNPSSRTIALASTHSLTEMSTTNLPGGKRRPAGKANNLASICEPRRQTNLWDPTAYYRDSFTALRR